jgi:hypothetical protein
VHSGEGSVGGAWGFAGFEPSAEGYMAYACAPADKEACLAHWRAIEEAAAQGRCVGWGAVGEDNGRVREHGTPSTSLDTWVLGEGVDRSVELLEQILDDSVWQAFGHIAAEADLARMRG